jgi:hypothetical protein
MSTHPLYTNARASALPNSDRPGRPEYDLIARLRAVRQQGDEAMTAVEEFDPDFSIKLSNCATDEAAEKLLADWLEHRTRVLRQVQDGLQQAWRHARRSEAQEPARD